MRENDVFLTQLFHGLMAENDKLLVGGRVDKKAVSLVLEYLFHAHGHINGVARDVEIEVVGEEGVKLYTE